MSRKKYYNQKPIQPIEVVLPDLIEVEVVVKDPMFVVIVDDKWLSEFPFTLTEDIHEAKLFKRLEAEICVGRIQREKLRKAKIAEV